eukprot:CAMPEP_0175774466 /NCGR_PEP_ID=MMETSP0097-20121207/73618_1 /TAXON_ID=311494 /ORGANISM="Alexandrium monilatum, Strain CCMP3105" /LENGTH=53 /DNA_ID=CAMNT_0017084929 /DNA_START=26 /DNA_END=183 /DNA_ORIENTATION=-
MGSLLLVQLDLDALGALPRVAKGGLLLYIDFAVYDVTRLMRAHARMEECMQAG